MDTIAASGLGTLKPTGQFLADRVKQESLSTAGGQMLALTQTYYDIQPFGALGAHGDPTRVRRYYDLVGNTSSDTTAVYDSYGNRTQATTHTTPNITPTPPTTTTPY